MDSLIFAQWDKVATQTSSQGLLAVKPRHYDATTEMLKGQHPHLIVLLDLCYLISVELINS